MPTYEITALGPEDRFRDMIAYELQVNGPDGLQQVTWYRHKDQEALTVGLKVDAELVEGKRGVTKVVPNKRGAGGSSGGYSGGGKDERGPLIQRQAALKVAAQLLTAQSRTGTAPPGTATLFEIAQEIEQFIARAGGDKALAEAKELLNAEHADEEIPF